MTSVQSFFRDIDEMVKLQVRLGDRKHVMVKGKGTVAIKTRLGTEKLTHDVYYVPGLAYNLISVGQLA